MLKELMKKVFNTASAETQEESMTTETDKADLAIETNTVAELTAQLASVTDAMATMQNQMAALATLNEQAKAALAASEAEKVSLAKEAADKRLTARTEAITKAAGTSKLQDALAATAEMNDAQFDVIVGLMKTSLDNEAESTMFQEKGAAAESNVVESTAASRLAAQVAKEFTTK